VTAENNPERRVLAAVLVLRFEDGMTATVTDVAAMLEADRDVVTSALASLEAQGLLIVRDETIELGPPPRLKITGLRGLAVLAEYMETGHTPSGSEVGRCLGASRRTGVTALDTLEELGYTAIDPRTKARRVFRSPPIPDAEWQEFRREARASIELPETRESSAYNARIRASRATTLRAFVEYVFLRGRAPSFREHAAAAGKSSIESNMRWFEKEGYFQRDASSGELRLATLPGAELVESPSGESIESLVRRRLADCIEIMCAMDDSGRTIQQIAPRAGMTNALARRVVAELGESGALEWNPDDDRCRPHRRTNCRPPAVPAALVVSADEGTEIVLTRTTPELGDVERVLLVAIESAGEAVSIDDCAKRSGLSAVLAAATVQLLAARGLVSIRGQMVETARPEPEAGESSGEYPAERHEMSHASEPTTDLRAFRE
jgi:DNA-binding IclR family transcriptional regulator